jgi:glucokinase
LRNFVTVVMGTGIGAAVVANGRLVKGRHNAAGELGYLLTSREQLHALRLGQASEVGERPGGYGGLEKVAAGPSIASRARALVAAGAASSLAGQPVTPEAIFAAAAAGDPLSQDIIDELLDHTALALAAITAIVDPEVIILDGSIGRSLEPYLADLTGRLTGRLLAMPRLCISRLGPNATVVGAIAAALQLARERSAPSSLFGAFTVGGRVEPSA